MGRVWWVGAAAVAVALASPRHAGADAKTQALAVDYEKEANACDIRAAGLDKAIAGATELVAAETVGDSLLTSLRMLNTARDTVVSYCDALAAMLQLLHADPRASYKSIEKQIDDGDNKIRVLRRANDRTIKDTGEILATLIPRINARRAAGETGRLPRSARTFPSGRTLLLPAWPGTWRVYGGRDEDTLEYREGGAMLSLEARATPTTCDGLARLVTTRSKTVDMQLEAPNPKANYDLWVLLWPAGAVWKASYTAGGRFVQLACVPLANGSVQVTLDEPAASRLDQDVNDIAPAMSASLVSAMAQTATSK